MRVTKDSQCEAFVNVCEFSKVYPAVYPSDSLGRQLVTRLEGISEEIARLDSTQAAGIRLAQRNLDAKMRTRESVHESLVVIATTAHGIIVDHPAAARQFRLPHSRGEKALLKSAEAFVEHAAPLRQQFVHFGMQPDFIEDLQSRIKALKDASAGHKSAKNAHTTATRTIDDLIEKGRTVLKQLDPITQNALRGDAVLTAAWERIRWVTVPAAPSKSVKSEADAKTVAKAEAGDSAPAPVTGP